MKLPGYVGAMLKAMGYRAGTPDILILEPHGPYHGLFIEIKTEEGTLSPFQKEFILLANGRGYKAEVCYGYKDACEVLEDYLSLPRLY